MLFFASFYFIGRRVDLGLWGGGKFKKFALVFFVAGVIGLFVGDVLAILIEGPLVNHLWDLPEIEELAAGLVLSGTYVTILGFVSVSLGFVANQASPSR